MHKRVFRSLVSLKSPNVYSSGRNVSVGGREPKPSLEAALPSGRWETPGTVQDQAHLHTGAVRSDLAQVFNYDALGKWVRLNGPQTQASTCAVAVHWFVQGSYGEKCFCSSSAQRPFLSWCNQVHCQETTGFLHMSRSIMHVYNLHLGCLPWK